MANAASLIPELDGATERFLIDMAGGLRRNSGTPLRGRREFGRAMRREARA